MALEFATTGDEEAPLWLPTVGSQPLGAAEDSCEVSAFAASYMADMAVDLRREGC